MADQKPTGRPTGPSGKRPGPSRSSLLYVLILVACAGYLFWSMGGTGVPQAPQGDGGAAGQTQAAAPKSGGRLSTGEKQLISFARAILANPSIFVLDEATSSIDTQTEQLIQQATARLLKGHTSFIIAHRLSTIRQADLILVVKDGKIIEQGTHKELLLEKGYYYDLYSKQFEEEASMKAFRIYG